ncbi:MAG: DNA polymerase IV [Sedimenticola sp.]|nr:DNA polymerase IV [Sedimenticola sp.]
MTREPLRWIMHVDMDAFFASVEQRDHPELRNRPVVVGAAPGSRGVVATCSYEARRFGIRSAMPISEAYRRCPDAVYLRPDGERYREVSRQVMVLLERISPLVEPVSIDEAYLDISGLERLYGAPAEIARRVRSTLREVLDLGCSVGVGPNRLIAKLASEYDKPEGLKVVSPAEVIPFLDPMPVSNLRGVGPRGLDIVRRIGIKTVAELRRQPRELLCEYFGERMGHSLYQQARGQASNRVGLKAERQSLSKETTFARDVTDRELLRTTLRDLCAEVGRLLRREGLRGRVVTLKVRFGGFETHTRRSTLAQPCDGDRDLYRSAWLLLQSEGFLDRPLRLIGVAVSDWEAGRNGTLDLFDSVGAGGQQLYRMIDQVNDRFGDGKLSFGLPTRRRKQH